MKAQLIKSFTYAVLGVLVAFWLDMGTWNSAVQKAKKEGRPIPAFDWQTAWPKYMTGFVGGLATSFADGMNIPLEEL